MIKLSETLGQPFADGVTVINAVSGVVPVLTAVKDAISPKPLAGKPIDVLLLTQLKLVPTTDPVKFIIPVAAVLQNVLFGGGNTLGIGFTVIVNILGVPGQIPLKGVTVIVAVTGALPVLMAVKAGISPLPPAARPMEVFVFVHEKVVPLIVGTNATAFVVNP
jgi:hypothetical protein